MYKPILFSIALLGGICGFAKQIAEAPIRPSTYRITDLGVDSTILDNQIRISGQTYTEGNLTEGVLVTTDSRADEVRSNSEGQYSMIIFPDSEKPQIVCKAVGYNEQVIKNIHFELGHAYSIDWFFYNRRGSNNTMVKKPVIYLYSEDEKDVELSIKPKANLSFTYPEMEGDNWSFKLDSSGIQFQDGKSYPYLFWEAENANLRFKMKNSQLEGFVVSGDGIINFFEAKLPDLGLNNKEMADFITFWGPEMSQNESNLVQFWIDEAYHEQICEMRVTPQPEASRRIYMIYAPVNDSELDDVEIIEPTFNEFTRRSYTLIEWGGSRINFKPGL